MSVSEKFKVGDQIRRVKQSKWPEDYGVKDEIYTVLEVHDDQPVVIKDKGAATARDFELATPKFKVGDRVRVIDDGGGAKIGDVGVVTASYPRYRDALLGDYYHISNLSNDAEGLYEVRLEPAPLFAVGDKVRLLEDNHGYGKKGDTGIIESIGLDDCFVIFDKLIRNRSGWYVALNTIEHATTDEEAVGPTINEIRSLYGYPPIGSSSTTGFTIPTDEEALPPKIVKRRAKAPFIFDGGILKLDHVSTGVVSASILRDRNGDYIDLVNRRIVINDNKPKPRLAIVALVENGQPLPSDKPKVHKTVNKATKEADRLAVLHPGQEFGVFELVSKRVATVDIREAA